jgi:hypothetical protein
MFLDANPLIPALVSIVMFICFHADTFFPGNLDRCH